VHLRLDRLKGEEAGPLGASGGAAVRRRMHGPPDPPRLSCGASARDTGNRPPRRAAPRRAVARRGSPWRGEASRPGRKINVNRTRSLGHRNL